MHGTSYVWRRDVGDAYHRMDPALTRTDPATYTQSKTHAMIEVLYIQYKDTYQIRIHARERVQVSSQWDCGCAYQRTPAN